MGIYMSNLVIGSVVGAGTAQSVLYIDSTGKLAQNNANFQFDGTNKLTVAGSIVAPVLNGDTAANGDLRMQGTTSATRATSYVTLQENGGFTGVGMATPLVNLQVLQSAGATGFGVYTGQSNAVALYDANMVVKTTVTGASPNLVTVGFYSDMLVTATGTNILELPTALNATLTISGTATYLAGLSGVAGFYQARYEGTGTAPTMVGVLSAMESTNSGTIPSVVGLYTSYVHSVTGNGTVTILYGLDIVRPVAVAGHTITNTYGIYIDNQTVAAGTQTNVPWGLYQAGAADNNRFEGAVGIKMTPTKNLELLNDSAQKPGVGGLWTVTSDKRLKENIELADLERCYEIIKAVPLKRFSWKKEAYANSQIKDRNALGWIADDVKTVFPKAVNKGKFTMANGEVMNDLLDLDGGQMQMALYGAVQQLMKENEELKEKVYELSI